MQCGVVEITQPSIAANRCCGRTNVVSMRRITLADVLHPPFLGSKSKSYAHPCNTQTLRTITNRTSRCLVSKLIRNLTHEAKTGHPEMRKRLSMNGTWKTEALGTWDGTLLHLSPPPISRSNRPKPASTCFFTAALGPDRWKRR